MLKTSERVNALLAVSGTNQAVILAIFILTRAPREALPDGAEFKTRQDPLWITPDASDAAREHNRAPVLVLCIHNYLLLTLCRF